MPYLTTTGGLNFQYPTDGTQNWGSTLKTSFNTISAHNHTGAPNGVQLSTNSLQANAVTEPKIRLTNNAYLRGRNAADSGDVNMIKVNASDVVQLGNGTSNILIDGANINLNGTLTFGSGMPSITFPAASAATPGIAFTGDPDTGFFSSAANTVNLSTGGTERWKVDISAFTSTLPVVHPLGSVSAPSLTFSGDLNTGVYSSGADTLDFATNGVNRFSLSTSAATSTLPVVVPLGSVSAPSLTFAGDLNTGIFSAGADVLGLVTGGTERVVVASTGSVGIGVSPSVDLHLQRSGDCRFRIESTGGAAFDQHIHFKDTTSDWYIGNRYNAPNTSFGIGRTAAKDDVIFDDGTTIFRNSPSASTTKEYLRFENNTAADSITSRLAFYNYNSITNAIDSVQNAGTNFQSRLVFSTNPGGGMTGRMTINADGSLTCLGVYNATVGGTNRDVFVDNTGVVGYVTSVRESKFNIESLNDIGWIYQLNPVSFYYKKRNQDGDYVEESDGDIQYGMIAEDVEPIRPDLCFYDEIDGTKVLRGIQYSKLTAVLLKAIQELNTRLAALEAQP